MPMQGMFDASQFAPKQAGAAHPVGNKFPFTISNTSIEPTKDNTGGMFVIEFTTPAGSIMKRYNLWNQSAKAVEIANHELSALCHATGVFKLDFQNDGAALRGARGQLDVALQDVTKPDGYVEVKKVYDANGNEPGRTGAAPQPQPQTQGNGASWGQPAQQAPSTQQQGQPMTQQSGGSWGNAGAGQQNAPQTGWNNTGVQNTQQVAPSNQPPWVKQ